MSLTDPKGGSLLDSILLFFRQFAEALVVALVVGLVLRWAVIAPYRIRTIDMEPTIKAGDLVFAYKLPLGVRLPGADKKISPGSPQKGQLVLYECPERKDQLCVHRVLALPGDRVEIKSQRLIVNSEVAKYRKVEDTAAGGALLEESIFNHSHLIAVSAATTLQGFGPAIVPPGQFFVLSDNRDGESDSRKFGFIPMANAVGSLLNWALSFQGSDWFRKL